MKTKSRADYIMKRIEELRPKMDKIYSEKNDLQDPELLELDQEMEELTTAYYHAAKQEGNNSEKIRERLYNTAIENIVKILSNRDISPKEFAEKIKLKQIYFLDILSGRKKLTLIVLVRIARVLDVGILDLFEKKK